MSETEHFYAFGFEDEMDHTLNRNEFEKLERNRSLTIELPGVVLSFYGYGMLVITLHSHYVESVLWTPGRTAAAML